MQKPLPLYLRALLSCWIFIFVSWYLILRTLRFGCNVWRMWVLVKRFGVNVKRRWGVGKLRQFASLFWLAWRYQINPLMYYRHRMYSRPLSHAPLFVTGAAMGARIDYMIKAMQADLYCMKDKRRFEPVCKQENLPVAETVAEFTAGKVNWWHEAHLPQADLFCKEAAAGRGAGAESWEYLGDGRWQSLKGQPFRAEDLIQHLQTLSEKAPMVLQRKLRSHPELEALSPGGISTLRVLTSVDPDTMEARVVATTFKMLKAGQVTDHWRRGGVASAVEISTGTLRAARLRDLRHAYRDLHEHPDTRARITGTQLPLWQEVIALSVRAHSYYRQFPTIGWDVAITPEGPVLLEGNPTWDARLIQQPGDVALGSPQFFKDYLGWHRRMRLVSTVLPAPDYYHGWASSLLALKRL